MKRSYHKQYYEIITKYDIKGNPHILEYGGLENKTLQEKVKNSHHKLSGEQHRLFHIESWRTRVNIS